MGRGTLVLVVGPSGAGKDTLIAGARERLKSDPRFVFPRRVITRNAEAGGEDHIAVDVPTFEKMRAEGVFALAWEAHGFHYGVPVSINDDLANGRHVVVNTSRALITEETVKRFDPCMFVAVEARQEIRAARLEERKRENVVEIAERLHRSVDEPKGGWAPMGIMMTNEGTIEAGIEAFVRILTAVAHAES